MTRLLLAIALCGALTGCELFKKSAPDFKTELSHSWGNGQLPTLTRRH